MTNLYADLYIHCTYYVNKVSKVVNTVKSQNIKKRMECSLKK